MYNQQDGKKNESGATSFLERVGRAGANRLKKELLDDAKAKVDSIKFDTMQILTQKYHACKSQSKQKIILQTYEINKQTHIKTTTQPYQNRKHLKT